MKHRSLIFSIFLLISVSTSAQLAIGSWRTHLAYNNITRIAQTEEKVYAICDGALFSLDKRDESIELYSKITGLNDNNIVNIAYSHEHNTLLIAYANSNIDLITDDGIINISDIYRKNITVSKTINHILFDGDFAYLSCDFGIVAINLKKQEVADTYIIGPNATMISVKSLSIMNGYFFATTENNIYTAPTTGVNLVNYANWKTMNGVPAGTNSFAVDFNNALYLLKTDGGVHRFNANGWTSNIYTGVLNISANDGYFFVGVFNQMLCFKGDALAATVTLFYPNMGIYDSQDNVFWFAANKDGIGTSAVDGTNTNFFKPDGPAVNYAWRMKFENGKLVVVPGGRWAAQYDRDGYVMMYENGAWNNIYPNEITAVSGQQKTSDFVDVAIDPTDNGHFFVASYQLGLYEFRNNKFHKLYNADNSNIQTVFPDKKPQDLYYWYHRIDGLTFDATGNLWFLNMGVTDVVKYMTPDPDGDGPLDGTVKSVYYNDMNDQPTASEILIDKLNPNRKWVLITRAKATTALFVFDDNGTLDNTRDDKSVYMTYFVDQDGNKLQPANLLTIAQDNNNAIWIGTSEGPIIIDNPNRIFDANFTVTRVKIPRNDGTNFADFLLEKEKINILKVDGANRKWVGTDASGLFLLSPNGQKTVHHFTSENSPLLSNNIISLAINDKSGEVFVGTGNGIISYQSDATESGEKFQDVRAFPNPVRENYTGTISISGLIAGANVKITDLNGNVVYETTSNGGLATWDGTRKNGEKVATGIYLAICTSKDGKQNAIAKILIIN